MNVSIAYKGYIHTHYEDYKKVEWLRITTENVLFKASDSATHVIPIKKIVSFSVTQ